MTHWRTLLDSDVVRFVDLQRDYAVQIKKVQKGKVKGTGGKETAKGLIWFEGWPKPISAGADVLTQIGDLHGLDIRKWPGKWITIWPDPAVKYGGKAVGGVRVRPVEPAEADRVVPKGAPAKTEQPAADAKEAANG